SRRSARRERRRSGTSPRSTAATSASTSASARWGPGSSASRPRVVPRMGQADEAGRVHARVDVSGGGEAQVSTGVPVLDHVLSLLAQYASFDLALEIAPGEAEVEIAAAGRA